MELTIQAGLLKRLFRAVGKVIRTCTKFPALGHVELVAEPGSLKLRAVCMEGLQATARLDVTEAGAMCLVERGGSVLLEHRMLRDALENVSDRAMVTLTGMGNRLRLTEPGGEWRLLLSEDELPPEDDSLYADSKLVLVHALEPSAALRGLLEFAPQRDPRKALLGIHLTRRGGRLWAEATTGRIAARQELKLEERSRLGIGPVDCIVPAELVRLIAQRQGDWRLLIGQQRIEASLIEGAVEIKYNARLIDGPYPNLTEIMDEERTNCVTMGTLERKGLLGALKRAGRVTHAICLEQKTDCVRLRCADPIARELFSCALSGHLGGVTAIGFNVGYLLTLLNHVPREDQVTLRIKSARHPVILGGAGGQVEMIIMPVRLEDEA